MNRSNHKSQSGYVLLFMVLAILGIAGVVGAGFTQNVKKTVDRERYLHNEQVLKEAKQALLMYAYRYPETALAFNGTIRGPGRLPCPDTDAPGGAGTPNPVADCIAGGIAVVGRFPWNANGMDFYDVRDAANERLWYAVSQNFANPDLDVINSDTLGTITIHDQSGTVLYDGSVAGVAAVIIAPGPAIDRGGVAQNRQTAAQQLNPANYLDLFGALDNADFINSNAADGFVLGPIDNLAAGTIIVNDQIILVTAEEVIEMAEQATLQAYQKAINDYNADIGVDAYPWLDDYATLPTPPQVFDADVGIRLGRVPSIFTNYFDNNPAAEPGQPFLSDVKLRINLAPVLNPFPVPSLVADVISPNASIAFNIDDLGIPSPGDLTITPSVAGVSEVHYYWDEEPVGDGWQECLPVVTGTEQDCHQAAAAPGVPNSAIVPNEVATQVVRVTYSNTLAAGVPYTRPFGDILLTGAPPAPPLVYEDPTAGDHAYVFAEYVDGTIDDIDVTFFYDNYFLNSLDNVESGNVNYSLGVRYYPELPTWALDPALTLSGNNWHDSIQMAYAAGFQPGAAAACTPGTDCLIVNDAGGITDDKIAVLTIAADHNFVDEALDGFLDDLPDIFDPENDNADDTFDAWALTNNDKVLVIR